MGQPTLGLASFGSVYLPQVTTCGYSRLGPLGAIGQSVSLRLWGFTPATQFASLQRAPASRVVHNPRCNRAR
jgi:hypothetical protein